MTSAASPTGCFTKRYLAIVAHYEASLRVYGDEHRGVRWESAADAETRYFVMLGLLRASAPERVSLLDFGCGAAHLLDLIQRLDRQEIDYRGLDISEAYINLCRLKHPHIPFYCADILDTDIALPQFDYIVMNGVFTIKWTLTFEEMWSYFTTMLKKVFLLARRGIAFNVMTTTTDLQRSSFFHLPFDQLARFVTTHLSPHFTIHHDYGLMDYTVYVYHEPTRPQQRHK